MSDNIENLIYKENCDNCKVVDPHVCSICRNDRGKAMKTNKKNREVNKELLNAVQCAYRKHHLNDDSLGWDELSGVLHDALFNSMGPNALEEWKAEVKHIMNVTSYQPEDEPEDKK